jgi:outer membrane protein
MKKIFLLLTLVQLYSSAQETKTLQECFDKVEVNRLNFSQQKTSVITAEINLNFHKLSILPNVSGFSNINTSFGRRLDPFTNTFGTRAVNSQSYGLSTAIPIFSSLSYFNTRSTLTIQKLQATLALEQNINRIRILITENYIELAKIQVQQKLSELRINHLKNILDVQRILLQTGRSSVIDTLKSYAALQNEENAMSKFQLSRINAQVELNYWMGEPFNYTIQTQLESIGEVSSKLKLNEQFESESLELSQNLQHAQDKSRRSSLLPSISLNGSLGTGFSTNNKDFSVAGNPTIPYNEQLSQNMYQNIGFYINLPLFGRGEILQSRKIDRLNQEEMKIRQEALELQVSKKQFLLAQERLNKSAEKASVTALEKTMRDVYDKSLSLYKEGRSTYSELQTSFLEWQSKLLDLETIHLEIALLKMYEN